MAEMQEEINYEKNIKGCLLINWKTGNVKYLKKIPKTINPQLVAVGINLNVIVPKLKLVEVKGDIKITREQVNADLVDQL